MTPIPRPDAQAVPHAHPFEAIGIVVICFGAFMLSSLQVVVAKGNGTASTTGFSNAGFDAMLVFELILAATAVAVLWSRRYPVQTLWPQASWRGALTALGLYLAVVLLCRVGWILVPPQAGYPLADIMENTSVSWSSVIPVAIVNGTYEEVFLMGYLMRGLRRFGGSTAIGITVLVRMLYHIYQGPGGVLAVTLCGIVFGVYYQRRGQLFPVVLAHVIADMAAFL